MAEFYKSKEFANLNVGFGMDEGITSDNEDMILSYTERSICRKFRMTNLFVCFA